MIRSCSAALRPVGVLGRREYHSQNATYLGSLLSLGIRSPTRSGGEGSLLSLTLTPGVFDALPGRPDRRSIHRQPRAHWFFPTPGRRAASVFAWTSGHRVPRHRRPVLTLLRCHHPTLRSVRQPARPSGGRQFLERRAAGFESFRAAAVFHESAPL